MTRMLIIGPPGSGKGTQAARIAERLDVATISTGTSSARTSRVTPLGSKPRSNDAGDLVPDSSPARWSATASRGRRSTRFPAGRLPAQHCAGGLTSTGSSPTATRSSTSSCSSRPTTKLSPACWGRAKETGRTDDNEAVIRHRLDLYHGQTEAVVAKYADRGILTRVDGIGGIDEVTDRVMQAIKEAQSA